MSSRRETEKDQNTCANCGAEIRLIRYALGDKFMHVSRYASFPQPHNGTAWEYCRLTVAEPHFPPGVMGRSDPNGGDGYVPGAWDEVRSAYLDGHISASAYDALRALAFPPDSTGAEQ